MAKDTDKEAEWHKEGRWSASALGTLNIPEERGKKSLEGLKKDVHKIILYMPTCVYVVWLDNE